MKRAAIYLRVSTAAQAKRNREPEGYSIPAQREACVAKAAELGASFGGGSNEALIIGAAGFEPAASCSQSKCATRLRYAPLHTRVRGVGATC